jgi:hypothetical protein
MLRPHRCFKGSGDGLITIVLFIRLPLAAAAPGGVG